jgi:hypothetical protein
MNGLQRHLLKFGVKFSLLKSCAVKRLLKVGVLSTCLKKCKIFLLSLQTSRIESILMGREVSDQFLWPVRRESRVINS